MAAIERTVIHPRLEEKWEKLQVAACVVLMVLGVTLSVTFANAKSLMQQVNPNEAGLESLRYSLAGQLITSVTFTLCGIVLQRRRVFWRIVKGEIRPSRIEEVQGKYPVDILFNLLQPVMLFSVAVLAVAVLRADYSKSPSSWTTLAVLSATSGYAAGKLSYTFWGFLERRGSRDTERPLDAAAKGLFLGTTLLFLCLKVNEYKMSQPLLVVRKELYFIAKVIEGNRVPLSCTQRGEKLVRREIEISHTRIAQLVREHARTLAKVHSEEKYKNICLSMLSGLLAALDEDMDGLLENAPEFTKSSRALRFARHVAPAAVMAMFAGVIPVLPGVGSAAGSVSVFLLATAALTLIPGSAPARAAVEGALNKALPTPSKP
ncbi:hypothetical protein AB0K49_31090 [Streptomyces decoyicus]|uniref:hypothetical protein n=1 Tax=Streptomyces decoyicus TaxID=249567 RepID=UPI00345D2FCD